jgi:hypothetical protein
VIRIQTPQCLAHNFSRTLRHIQTCVHRLSKQRFIRRALHKQGTLKQLSQLKAQLSENFHNMVSGLAHVSLVNDPLLFPTDQVKAQLFIQNVRQKAQIQRDSFDRSGKTQLLKLNIQLESDNNIDVLSVPNEDVVELSNGYRPRYSSESMAVEKVPTVSISHYARLPGALGSLLKNGLHTPTSSPRYDH